MSETVYFGIFFKQDMKQKLLEQFPNKHPKIFGDHVTLAYKPTENELNSFKPRIGTNVLVAITGEKYDDKGHLVLVEVSSQYIFRGEGEQPLHVTISCQPKVPPSYSKDLYKLDSVATRPVTMFIMGYFDTFPSSIVPMGD